MAEGLEENEKVHRRVLHLLLEQGYFAFVANFVNSLLYVVLSWSHVQHLLLLVWLAVTYLTTAVRLYLYRKSLKLKDSLEKSEIDQILRMTRISIGISGCLWGAIGLAFLVSDSRDLLVTTTFFLAGMTAGAVGAYSIALTSVVIFLSGALLPLILVLLFHEQSSLQMMGGAALLYYFLMLAIARNANKRTALLIRLGFENEELMTRVSDVSHEIRTPLAIIVGYADFLNRNNDSSEEAKRFSNIILRNSQYMKRLVDNILLLSDSNLKGFERLEWVNIKEEIHDVFLALGKKFEEKGLETAIEFSPQVPERILIDSLTFQQILLNLLSNALKFTQKGKVSLIADTQGQDRLEIRVRDTGIGIETTTSNRLFVPFFRENREEVKSQEGSGLGLALSRRLARKSGGDLRLETTQMNRGSTFLWEIPISQTAAIKLKRMEAKSRLLGSRIALVDDSQDILDLFKRQLETEGAVVSTFSDGHQVVKGFLDDKNFDCVLMDINMPTMDGYLATENLRREGYTKPIIALSAYSQLEIAKNSTVKFSDYIGKSDDLEQLTLTVKKWIG
jgi:signal transduction histidine kinase/CheY-like chemotaxis protein